MSEPLELVHSYVAPVGGFVRPASGPTDDLYLSGRFVIGPVCIEDGCPAPLDEDEEVLSRWFVPRAPSSPTEVFGTVDVDGPKRRPVARSSWYLLLTSRLVRVVGVLAKEAQLVVDGAWSTPPNGGWLTFAFDLRELTYFSGSRKRVLFGDQLSGFSGTAFMVAEPEARGWATPSTRSRTPDFGLELGRALLQAKRDSGDVDQEGAADTQARTDWESKVTGRLRSAELSFPPYSARGNES